MTRYAELRRLYGLKQSELAAYLHQGPAAVSKYEQGLTEPPIEILKALARLYHVSIDYLLGVSDVPLPANCGRPDRMVHVGSVLMPQSDFIELSALVAKAFPKL